MHTEKLDVIPTCPHCQKTLDGYTSENKVEPTSGSVTVCCHCMTILVFGESLNLRLAPLTIRRCLPFPLLIDGVRLYMDREHFEIELEKDHLMNLSHWERKVV